MQSPVRPGHRGGRGLFPQQFLTRSFFMAAAYLPSVLVPLVGLVFPAIAMASLFLYIEKEEIA
nr:subunit VIII of photosystem I [Paradoxia multiseta]AIT94923.1 subunit VIII of photosystem I [Paradoxia multiseta]